MISILYQSSSQQPRATPLNVISFFCAVTVSLLSEAGLPSLFKSRHHWQTLLGLQSPSLAQTSLQSFTHKLMSQRSTWLRLRPKTEQLQCADSMRTSTSLFQFPQIWRWKNFETIRSRDTSLLTLSPSHPTLLIVQVAFQAPSAWNDVS